VQLIIILSLSKKNKEEGNSLVVFINDLPLSIPHGDIDMYADDSTITTSAKTINQLNENLNQAMDEVSNLVPRAFPFLSLGRREKALAPGGLLCILIGQ
jgi:hypothetical protein